MDRASQAVHAAALLLFAACSVDRVGLGAGDGEVGGMDAGGVDSSRPRTDSGPGAPDSGGRVDAGSGEDAGRVDAGSRDAGRPPDAGPPDAGPCPDGDADGDGVCDPEDECPGHDDAEDEDGDDIPDGCDPCSLDGPDAAPIGLPASASGVTITRLRIGGGGNVAVVDRGDTVELDIDYEIVDCGCPGCIDQIEIGLVPGGGVSYCAYSAVPGCSGDEGSDVGTLTAPSAAGEYFIRFGRGQDYNCHEGWWEGTPGPARNIGALCVR